MTGYRILLFFNINMREHSQPVVKSLLGQGENIRDA
jgi:hypothetical protein